MSLVAGLAALLVAVTLASPPSSTTGAPRPELWFAERLPLEGWGREAWSVEVAAGSALPRQAAAPAKPVVNRAPREEPIFARIAAYDLAAIFAGDDVPRAFATRVPAALSRAHPTEVRKALFFKTVLPLVLHVNETIADDRRRLWTIAHDLALGRSLDAADRLFLAFLAERYQTADGDLTELLRRVDVVPPSLALAQAAAESGWGTSRFVREGNALFGQWTWSTGHQVPAAREAGKTHLVAAFPTLADSVRAYALNLNTHGAYENFRRQRETLRHVGAPLDGRRLATTLVAYAERRWDYIGELVEIIGVNGLTRLDDARLQDPARDADPLI